MSILGGSISLAPWTGLGTGTRARAEQGCQLSLAETCSGSDNACNTVRFSSFISYCCHTCLSVPTQGLSSATASAWQPGDELSGVSTVKAKSLDSVGKVPNDASSHCCWCVKTSTLYFLLSCLELGNIAGVTMLQSKKKIYSAQLQNGRRSKN